MPQFLTPASPAYDTGVRRTTGVAFLGLAPAVSLDLEAGFGSQAALLVPGKPLRDHCD